MNPSGGFPFFATQTFTQGRQPIKSEDSLELCLAPGLLYRDGGMSRHSSSCTSHSEELLSHGHVQLIPQIRRLPSEAVSSLPPSSTSSPHPHPESAVAPTASTTTASAVTQQTKPKRCAPATRVSSKDFVPPDVTGLSKREARLVKNRAAAFLSRQRKREEFEALEM